MSHLSASSAAARATAVVSEPPRPSVVMPPSSVTPYDEMLELANLGAGVLHPRAVEFAKNYQVPLEVRSSTEHEAGTLIEEESSMEQNLIVRGIAFEDQITSPLQDLQAPAFHNKKSPPVFSLTGHTADLS